MGGTYSTEDVERASLEILNESKGSNKIPDIEIDMSLKRYSGLNSAEELQNYSTQLMNDLLSNAPGSVANLCSSLARFTPAPIAVGLGAMIIRMVLDSSAPNKSSEDIRADMVRRVFAEEKASGVRDSMDECVKQLCLCVNELEIETEIKVRKETLSNQLTALRNSMLHDNQMRSRAMKCWANGAAFHVQMLIHAARLKMVKGSEAELQRYESSISILLDLYQQDLKNLLEKYKIYKKSTLYFRIPYSFTANNYEKSRHVILEDKELMSKLEFYKTTGVSVSVDDYVNYMFNNWNQIKELRDYFSDLKKNLRELILQHDAFNNKLHTTLAGQHQ